VEILFSLIDISDKITGSAQPKLNQAKLNELIISIPPIFYLESYYLFLCQVDQLKSKLRESLTQTKTLFNSLMQQYFG
ncbi:MAG: hypothetical protein IKX88_11925, partial [Thermoguttaceae bacterium]|nr:hypothetical protein [Thermoguttaceae bacterium]